MIWAEPHTLESMGSDARSGTRMGRSASGDLGAAIGYAVADLDGRRLGTVEELVGSTGDDGGEALAVSDRRRFWQQSLVPVEAVEQVDSARALVVLRVEDTRLRSFPSERRGDRRARAHRKSRPAGRSVPWI